MSFELNIISSRPKALSKLIKAAADFLEGTPNKRVNCQFSLNLNAEEKET